MRNLVLVCLIIVALATSALGFAPETLTFQGRLSETGGSALADGNYSVTFRLYTQLNGGAPIWNSTRQVTLAGGLFSIILGENNPLALPFDQQYFVGVQYEAEPEMIPRVPLSSNPYALGVSENAAVTSLNNLTGDINLQAGSNVNIGLAGNDLVISATGAVADNDWTVSGVDMYAIPTGNVGVGTMLPESKLHVAGNIISGESGATGTLYARNTGDYLSNLGGDHFGQGSQLNLYQEDGFSYLTAQPDFDGDGGFFDVLSGNGGSAFLVDGSNAGGDALSYFGGPNPVAIQPGESGDDSVQLPGNSVNSLEIENEPGLASSSAFGTGSSPVGPSYGPITSRTITVPTAGYVLATSSAEIEMNHEGASCYVTAGLSTMSNSLPTNQDLSFYLPPLAAQGQYLIPISPTAVFPVMPGSHTIYFVSRRVGTSDAVMWDVQLNLLFVPTAYGTVELAGADDDGDQQDNDRVLPAISSGDISEERRQSISDNDQRVADELAELRSRIDALQAEINGNK